MDTVLSNTRIVFFTGTMGDGGGQRVISLLVKGLVEAGAHCEIVTYYNEDVLFDIDKRVKVKCIAGNEKRKNILANIIWIRKYFRENADVVISFLAPFNMIAIMATLFSKKRIIVADRSDPYHVPQSFIIRKLRDFLYLFCDKAVFQTETNKSYFPRLIQRKSIVIANPVSMGKYAGYGVKCKKEKKVVSVGRLINEKNHELLIKSFCSIHDNLKDYWLEIYGDGNRRDDLQRLIEEFNAKEYVFLKGRVKDVFERISTASLFVLSSNYEGMPNALIEAMCEGLPVISTRVSGAKELIEDGKNGILVDIGDQKQLEKAMLELLNNADKRSDYANRAVEVNRQLSEEAILREWIKLIDETIGGKQK